LYSVLPAAINPYNPASAISVFFPDNANRMLYIDDLVVFQNAGAQWDNGRFVVIAERNWLDADDQAPAAFQNRFYALAGVRFGDFLIHYTWAERDDDLATLTQGMPTTGPFAGVTAGVNAVAATLPQTSEQSTIGLRWDFTTSAAFKIEYMMQEDSKASNPHDVNVLRFGVQTVF